MVVVQLFPVSYSELLFAEIKKILEYDLVLYIHVFEFLDPPLFQELLELVLVIMGHLTMCISAPLKPLDTLKPLSFKHMRGALIITSFVHELLRINLIECMISFPLLTIIGFLNIGIRTVLRLFESLAILT